MTREKQDQLTPKDAFRLLQSGNTRFLANLRANRNLLTQVNETGDDQFPFATILSCIDSRTSAELIFDQGLGDIFSIRIAGNFIDEDILGSMEFTAAIAGAKLILVLGHSRCGAIKAACDNVVFGHLTSVVEKIRPSVELTRENGARDSSNAAFVNNVAVANVRASVKGIYERSSVLRDLVDQGKLAIIGGHYDVQTGAVEFFVEDSISKETLAEAPSGESFAGAAE